jgi:carboxyl-terminal processing protease
VPDLNYPQLYKIEETGESSLDGALPWDTTIKTAYRSYPSLYAINEQLDTGYRERSLTDPGLNYLKKRIDIASKINSQTAVSLNLDDRKSRKKEYELQELDIENEYLRSMGEPPREKMDQEDTKTADFKKILMHQTHLVMADFISLSGSLGFSW